MSKIAEMSPGEVSSAREAYLWDRQWDARDAVGMALRSTVSRHMVAGIRDRVGAADAMTDILGAVVPERRGLLIDTMIDLYEQYAAVREATPDVKASAVAAYQSYVRVVRDAAHAQIAGTVFLFGGGSR